MSPKLRRLSGRDLVAIFAKFNFVVLAQKGSHIKLRRSGEHGEKQTLVVPDHKELDSGTLRAIYRQASRYIPSEQLSASFFSR